MDGANPPRLMVCAFPASALHPLWTTGSARQRGGGGEETGNLEKTWGIDSCIVECSWFWDGRGSDRKPSRGRGNVVMESEALFSNCEELKKLRSFVPGVPGKEPEPPLARAPPPPPSFHALLPLPPRPLFPLGLAAILSMLTRQLHAHPRMVTNYFVCLILIDFPLVADPFSFQRPTGSHDDSHLSTQATQDKAMAGNPSG